MSELDQDQGPAKSIRKAENHKRRGRPFQRLLRLLKRMIDLLALLINSLTLVGAAKQLLGWIFV